MKPERSIGEVQSDMQYLLDRAPSFLTEHFSGFLNMPLHTKAQRVAAGQYLCSLTGLPVL